MIFLALRHILSRKQQTLLTFIGIVLGSAGYVVFSGIMLGFHEYLIDRLVNSDGHIRITARDEIINEESLKKYFLCECTIKWLNKTTGRKARTRLSNVKGWHIMLNSSRLVKAYSDQINREVILKKGGFSKVGVLIGIDPEKQVLVTNINNDITYGKLSELNSGNSLIIIGEGLMESLGAKVNDIIQIDSGGKGNSPVKIIGTFKTGVKQLDNRLAYGSIETVQSVTKSHGEITKIIVKIDEIYKSKETAILWNSHTKDLVESWDQANENFLSMMSTQNTIRNTTVIILVLIVSFGIYNILNMVVTQKKKDIAILRSIGFNEKDTILLFLIQGIIISIAGSLLGLIVGAAGSLYIETIKINRGVGHMLISWDAMIYIKSFLLVVVSSTIASLIPAKAAGRLSPIDIIRGAI